MAGVSSTVRNTVSAFNFANKTFIGTTPFAFYSNIFRAVKQGLYLWSGMC
jgi:hypothetical protein